MFEDVVEWCAEITVLMEKEISGGSIDLKALIRRVRTYDFMYVSFEFILQKGIRRRTSRSIPHFIC